MAGQEKLDGWDEEDAMGLLVPDAQTWLSEVDLHHTLTVRHDIHIPAFQTGSNFHFPDVVLIGFASAGLWFPLKSQGV